MEIKELEFRGIHLEHLKMYFQELGGELVTDSFPFIYEGDGWSTYILREEEIAFTNVFKVNAVFIRFAAKNEEILEKIMKSYRMKTFRAGG
ncbi:hypothetical protein JMM81_04870 [Bacillus sp. V3B]|uniref:hypothetical protein n=1 Tax=Bacillus sp. V3B TaxID=2804915 RepID=UPI00210C1DB3|nr:hypothetical protein [Bacillus sp. V3B]MCQ6274309.1 hypothetical protein [Bacillus sp. V3B]